MSTTLGTQASIFVVITVLIDAMGFGMIMPVLPRLVVELTGDEPGDAAAPSGAATR